MVVGNGHGHGIPWNIYPFVNEHGVSWTNPHPFPTFRCPKGPGLPFGIQVMFATPWTFLYLAMGVSTPKRYDLWHTHDILMTHDPMPTRKEQEMEEEYFRWITWNSREQARSTQSEERRSVSSMVSQHSQRNGSGKLSKTSDKINGKIAIKVRPRNPVSVG